MIMGIVVLVILLCVLSAFCGEVLKVKRDVRNLLLDVVRLDREHIELINNSHMLVGGDHVLVKRVVQAIVSHQGIKLFANREPANEARITVKVVGS